ncbi:hypothetical protein EMCG_03780 [[Emmonsia] crescens]|uniref:Uncharacterized protein n=1 Tax=[Emmonsia] crescens TaxID=73230 RepID=A0A0G2J861_9EURO|nr:hypothetical protein EMCG_03780 [Emmonsia crescens UAMH 3008]
MCNFFKNFYIYSACRDPANHFFRISTDGSSGARCDGSPHERFIVVVGQCRLCKR